MELSFELFDQGITVSLDGRRAQLRWPEEIWAAFSGNHAFAAELVFLLTYGVALGNPDAEVRYDFARPWFLDTYDRWFAATTPYLAETIGVDADTLLRDRARLKRRFAGEPLALPRFAESDPQRAIVSLTMGKDSLASLVMAQALELDVVGVHCQHPSLSDDHRLRLPAMAALGDELGISMYSVIDDVKALSKTAAARGHRSGILSSLSIAAYALLLLPFAAFHRARYLLVGNEHELNHPTRAARSGALLTLAPLQTTLGMGELDNWISALTGGALRLTSPIHALHRLAGHQLIHRLRPEVGAHQISCRNASAEQRWCSACKTCAENALFIAAMGRDPAVLGLRPMFDQGDAEHFAIVADGLDPGDPYRFRLAEQELLAFAMLARGAEDTWVQRLVRKRHGDRFEADRQRLERTYLAPVGPPTALPLAAEAFACARRLLRKCRGSSGLLERRVERRGRGRREKSR